MLSQILKCPSSFAQVQVNYLGIQSQSMKTVFNFLALGVRLGYEQ